MVKNSDKAKILERAVVSSKLFSFPVGAYNVNKYDINWLVIDRNTTLFTLHLPYFNVITGNRMSPVNAATVAFD
jgi:hypothetical protein